MHFLPEPPSRTNRSRPRRGIETKLVTLPELRRMMQAMEFRHQLHWAIYAAAMLRGVCQDLTL